MNMQVFTDLKEAGAEQLAAVKTTDGKLWEDATAALKHQKFLNLKEALYNFADDHFHSGMSEHDIADAILENFDELQDLMEKRVA
jgi:hypothetical protein